VSHKSFASGALAQLQCVSLSFLALAAATGSAHAAPTSCEDLAKLALPHTEVTSATLVSAGAFTPPQGPGAGNPNNNRIYATLPAFCRVKATSRPTPESDIKIEVWLPASGWNGRLQAVGNGGFSSSLQYNAMAQAVLKGYAGTGNNTGQETNNADFAIGHPGRIPDWGSRAVHESAVNAKAIITAHYGVKPAYSYWNSCSTGGRQGLVAAEYYPEDFDGLAVGDPANPMTRLQANSIYITMALTKDEASFIPAETWAFVQKATMEQCDAKDGLKDGLISNPLACGFKPESLQCKMGQTTDCLTAPQIVAYRKILTGSVNPRTGEHLYPGYPPGTAMLPGPVGGKTPDNSAPATFKMLFQDKDWDYRTFDFDRDTARAAKLGANAIDAVDETKLAKLFARGGKLFMYHGWVDPAISPLISVDYYNKAVAANGGLAKADKSIRLFLVPGMAHCGGGYGPNTFDKMDVIADWVEHGKAPDRIIASQMATDKVVRTRPLCAYPRVVKYSGKGSIDEAANFACVMPGAKWK
jgi:feruloyl esterase